MGGTAAATLRLAAQSSGDRPAPGAGELAHRASRGDLDAFEALVRSYQRRVYGFAFQHLRDPVEAQDLAQEIFLRLFRNLARYDAERPFDPWFWRLAANTSINYARRRVPSPQEPPDIAGPEAAFAEESGLAEALAELDPGYRLPILLHYYADLPIEQVAVAVGLSVSAVKSRMHRARAFLRRSLAEAEA